MRFQALESLLTFSAQLAHPFPFTSEKQKLKLEKAFLHIPEWRVIAQGFRWLLLQGSRGAPQAMLLLQFALALLGSGWRDRGPGTAARPSSGNSRDGWLETAWAPGHRTQMKCRIQLFFSPQSSSEAWQGPEAAVSTSRGQCVPHQCWFCIVGNPETGTQPQTPERAGVWEAEQPMSGSPL